MARIAGVDLPRDKRVEIGLTYIYGIGVNTADKLLEEAGVSGDTRVKDLTDDEVKRIADALDKSGIGIRHRKSLPVRGQKTKTNARTRKGPKKTVANKKK